MEIVFIRAPYASINHYKWKAILGEILFGKFESNTIVVILYFEINYNCLCSLLVYTWILMPIKPTVTTFLNRHKLFLKPPERFESRTATRKC